MRFSFILLTLTIVHFANGQTFDSSKIRFDGFYQTISDIDKQDNDTTYDYLRFYPDGKVISVTSEGTAYDLKEWFDLKMNNPGIGSFDYKAKGEKNLFFNNQ